MIVRVCTCWLSKECIDHIDAFRPEILKILKKNIGFADESSAALTIEESSVANRATHNACCNVFITGMSLTPERTPEMIEAARQEIETLYAKTITRHPGDHLPVTLSVVIQLDRPLPSGSNLVEAKFTRTIT